MGRILIINGSPRAPKSNSKRYAEIFMKYCSAETAYFNLTRRNHRELCEQMEGYTDVLIQPTHVLNGAEYDKQAAQAAPFRDRFDRLVLGRPLLTREDDYKEVVRAMLPDLPEQEAGTAILYMGHGTEHFANSAYAMLEYVFHEAGRDDVFIGTVEGYPGFDQALGRIRARKVTTVELRSLMIVAGDHAKNDLAGPEEDSWKCRLEREGYAVRCVLRGMGELPGIQAMYVHHAREAEQTG